MTAELVRELSAQELVKVKEAVGGNTKPYDRAAQIFEEMSTSETFTDFLTLPLYKEIWVLGPLPPATQYTRIMHAMKERLGSQD